MSCPPRLTCGGAALLSLALVACGDDSAAPTDASPTSVDVTADTSPTTTTDSVSDVSSTTLTLSIISGRPEMVTGDSALVRVTGALDDLALALDGDPITTPTHTLGDSALARVTGLTAGAHTLTAASGGADATLEIMVYAITGPVFSGPHEVPYTCTTAANGLGVALDDDCSAAPVTVYFRKTATTFEPLVDPAAPPADTATATTLTGRVVPFVLRVEVRTINRAIAWIASLYDPELPRPEPWQRSTTWTGAAVYMFGGGCGTGYTQGDPMYSTALNDIVGAGYMLMHASLNTLGNNCNDVLAAETVMMVKEDFIERYGPPDYLLGFGGSGGSIQQHLIADDYPGLLDGLLPLASYPDVWSILPDIIDCKLLYAYFARFPELWPTEALRTAVTGFARDQTCAGWIGILGDVLAPSVGCLPGVPPEAVYDPVTNPDGARCTLQDHTVNIFGRDPATGFARRAWGNAAVQYGLGALADGAITTEQFVHLNEHVGSLDLDGAPVAERQSADPLAVATAYRSGRVLDGARLAAIPIIDVRAYGDVDPGDFHDSIRTLATRARLARHGDAANHVSFTAPADQTAAGGTAAIDALLALDAWLRALAADPDPDRAAAVRRTRPVGDRCYLTTTPSDGMCATLPSFETPRMVAGGPLTGDVLQCARVAIDDADYPGLTGAQRARLDAAFPDGVCDWSAEPPDRVPHAGPWQRF